jgi:hypothetical protein
VLLGNGRGSFSAHHDFAVGVGPVWVAVADFNGDGNMDVVTADYTAETVSILLGDGNGGLAAHHD